MVVIDGTSGCSASALIVSSCELSSVVSIVVRLMFFIVFMSVCVCDGVALSVVGIGFECLMMYGILMMVCLLRNGSVEWLVVLRISTVRVLSVIVFSIVIVLFLYLLLLFILCLCALLVVLCVLVM